MRLQKKDTSFAAGNPKESAEILLKYAPEIDKNLAMASQEYLSAQYIDEGTPWDILMQTDGENFTNGLMRTIF